MYTNNKQHLVHQLTPNVNSTDHFELKQINTYFQMNLFGPGSSQWTTKNL